MYEFTYQIKAEQIQSPYRHLHHADALLFLESARLDLLVQLGFPNQQLIEQDLLLVITEISIRYKRELFAGEIYVQCQNLRVLGRDLIIEQVILNDRRKPAVQATVTSCFMSAATRRALLPPEAFLVAFI